jgi:phenylacetate-CoA ligase
MSMMDTLVSRVLLPLDFWRTGDQQKMSYLREFERSQYWPDETLKSVQLGRLQLLIDHAWRNCPAYRARFEAAGFNPADLKSLDDLKSLPFLEKEDIQRNRDGLLASNWPKGDLLTNWTGGSTGVPVPLFVSKSRHRSRWAATMRHNRWAGWDIGDKFGAIWGARQDIARVGLASRLRAGLLERVVALDTGCVTEEQMRAFNERLKHTRPRVILAYAQGASLFARYLRANGQTAYQPQAMVTSAEVLDGPSRRLIEEVFGCPVFNRYGCREVSVIASECEAHSGMHVMAEGLLIEIVRGGNQAQPGELGEVVVTDLLNLAMPLIRYRIKDTAAWDEGSCACGRTLPRLRNVAGRTADFVVGSDGRLVSGTFLATYVVGVRPSLGQVQIVQEKQGAVHYKIKRGASFDESRDVEYLRSASTRYLGPDIRVTIELVDDIPHLSSGKFAFCRSTVVPDFLGDEASWHVPEVLEP